MIVGIVVVLFVAVVLLGWLVYNLQSRVIKMEENYETVDESFKTINKNEAMFQADMKKLRYEFVSLQKESTQKGRLAPKAKEPVRPR